MYGVIKWGKNRYRESTKRKHRRLKQRCGNKGFEVVAICRKEGKKSAP